MTKRCRDEENRRAHPLPQGRVAGAPPKRCRREEDEGGKMVRVEAISSMARGLREWRRKLELVGVGFEELLLGVGFEELLQGWFPFVEEDFCVEEEMDLAGWEAVAFDDIWQIRHINEIPTPAQSHGGVL